MSKKKEEVKTITLGRVIQWILAIIFVLGALSALFQPKIIAFIVTAAIAFMWTSIFDNLMEKRYKTKLSGWVKFFIMWGLLAILSFGGAYK